MDFDIAINRLVFIFGKDNIMVGEGIVLIKTEKGIKRITTDLINYMKDEQTLDVLINKIKNGHEV